MKLGLFGGTFDPVHHGHLIGAQAALSDMNLDKVIFVPASLPPHKKDRGITSPEHRVAMLRAAIEDNPGFDMSLVEMERGGQSFTIDTIRNIKSSLGDRDKLYLILGADNLVDFTTWLNWRDIIDECGIIALERQGFGSAQKIFASGLGKEEMDKMDLNWVRMPLVGISSTDIRNRVQNGRSIRYQVPRRVEEYILENSIYRRSLDNG